MIEAIDGAGGKPITRGLTWDLTNLDSGTAVLSGFDIATVNMALEPGRYRADVTRSDDGAKASAEFEVATGGDQHHQLVLESTLPDATVAGPQTAAAGSTVMVEWTGPEAANDFVSVAKPDQKGGQYVNYTYVREGSPLKLLMPAEPGQYELRYVLRDRGEILARQAVKVEAVTASVSAPATVAAGSTIPVQWTGPDYQNDYVSVARPDMEGGQYVNYTYTREGSPAKLVMPPEPGDYEIRYIQRQDGTILARQAVKVEAVQASVSAPATVAAGSTVPVQWSGPDYQNDYVSVARPDMKGSQYVNYTYTREGSPAKLVMPPEPGDYEIRYIQRQDGTVSGAAGREG